jgi:5-hydroxyisourate hydrolase-like protein (transthyretin family)
MKQVGTGNPITVLTTEIEHSAFGAQDVQIYIKYTSSSSSIPLMEGGTYVADVDNPKTIAQIRTEINLQAIDAHDGNITHLIQVYEDNYTGNESTIGIYDVVFYVEDSGGNGVYATIVIVVLDVTAPTVPGTQSVSRRYNQVFDYEAYIEGLTITDNYDDYEDLIITIDSNTYTGNESTVGSYQIVYRVEDLSENYTTGIINITVFDDIAPVISGPSTLSRSQSQTLTINQIVAQYTASDAHDGNITGSIYVHYNGYSNHSAPGTYTVILRVADASGNIGSKTISVTISDEIPPVFYVENNGKIIHVSALMTLSESNIVQILVARGFINLTPESITLFEINNYEMNAMTSGSYAMMLRIFDDDSYSTSMTYSFMMIVYGGDESLDPPPVTDEPAWYENPTYIVIGAIVLFGFIVLIRKKR